MAYDEGFGGANAIGVVLSVASAVGAALYRVNPHNCLELR